MISVRYYQLLFVFLQTEYAKVNEKILHPPRCNAAAAGAGKIDALAGLEALTGAAGIDVVAAGEKRTATPATMIGLDAPVFNVLGQRVSLRTKGLVIYKGRKYLNY